MPDDLMRRAKGAMVKRGMTFRSLVIDALENALSDPQKPFVLREASAGYSPEKGSAVSSERVNRAIDELREPLGAP